MTLDEATDIVEISMPTKPLDGEDDRGTIEARHAYWLTIDAARNFDELFRYGLPTCGGRWVRGSGGHKKFSRDCDDIATWSTWPDDGDHERYCDQCLPKNMIGLSELPWAFLVRVAYALGTRTLPKAVP